MILKETCASLRKTGVILRKNRRDFEKKTDVFLRVFLGGNRRDFEKTDVFSRENRCDFEKTGVFLHVFLAKTCVILRKTMRYFEKNRCVSARGFRKTGEILRKRVCFKKKQA